MHSKLYYDLGEGFCEEHTLYADGKLSGNRFRVEFALSGIKGIRNLRWNPANGHFLKVRIERLDCGCSAELVPQGVHMKVDNSTTAIFYHRWLLSYRCYAPGKCGQDRNRGKT